MAEDQKKQKTVNIDEDEEICPVSPSAARPIHTVNTRIPTHASEADTAARMWGDDLRFPLSFHVLLPLPPGPRLRYRDEDGDLISPCDCNGGQK